MSVYIDHLKYTPEFQHLNLDLRPLDDLGGPSWRILQFYNKNVVSKSTTLPAFIESLNL